MTDQRLVGVYPTSKEAEGAVRALVAGGYSIAQISSVARNLERVRDYHGTPSAGTLATTGALAGASLGGLFGLWAGMVLLWVPGIGQLLAAGPLAAALLEAAEGGVVGAADGGLLGALLGWSASRDDTLDYEEHLKGGKYLVVAHGRAEEVARAHDLP